MQTTEKLVSLPDPRFQSVALASSRALSGLLVTQADTQKIDLHGADGTLHSVVLPAAVMHLLVDILAEMGQGNAVSIVPIHAELSTQEAADLLGVSRPFLVQLLESSKIPFHKVGRHRRLRYTDVMHYRAQLAQDRKQALQALVAADQELGLY
jgi:excisionase family DNA binding protein